MSKILTKVVVGARLHGLNTPTSDYDYRGIPELTPDRGVAHSEQNVAFGALTVPHEGQPGMSRVAH